MADKIKNYGVILGSSPTTYGAGVLPYEIRNPSGDWEPFIPPGEWQKSDNGDSMSCVTFSAINSIETQENRMLYEGEIPDDLLQWCIDKGYLKKRS